MAHGDLFIKFLGLVEAWINENRKKIKIIEKGEAHWKGWESWAQIEIWHFCLKYSIDVAPEIINVTRERFAFAETDNDRDTKTEEQCDFMVKGMQMVQMDLFGESAHERIEAERQFKVAVEMKCGAMATPAKINKDIKKIERLYPRIGSELEGYVITIVNNRITVYDYWGFLGAGIQKIFEFSQGKFIK